jgi:hypothetical protein
VPQLIKRHLARLCCALLLLAAAAASASAAPLVITSGTLSGCPSCIDEIHFGSFTGGGFAFSGGSQSFRAQPLASAGGTVSASSRATFGGPGFQYYRATSGGLTYFVNRSSSLVFNSAPVVVPLASSGTLFLDVPFTMTGTLSLTDDVARINPPLFTFEVSGAGIARITLGLVADGIYSVRDITYTFLAPEAVPEPATMTLLGTGLAAALLRRRRSKQRAAGQQLTS